MSDFSVSTRYQAVDKMSGTFNKMKKSASGFGSVLKGVLGAQVIMRGVQMLGQGISAAANEFIAFDDAIVGATARFKDLTIGTQETADRMLELKKAARDVAAGTQFSAAEAAEGLNFFAKAGFTSTEAMEALVIQTDLATVAGMDLATTSDITSDLLSSLGKNSQDSAVKMKNLADMSRSLGLATNMANVDLVDLFESLKVAGPIATAAGEDMNQLVAITAALGGAGIKGSMAATAMKNAYTRLAAPTDKVSDALSQVGLSTNDFIDASGDMKSMVTIMGMLGKATADLGNAQQLQIFSDIFGKQAVAGATNMSKSLADIDLIMRQLEGDKKLKDIADEIRKGLGMRLKILKSSLLETGFKFIDVFETKLSKGLDKVIEMSGALNNFLEANKAIINSGVDKFFNVLKMAFDFLRPVVVAVANGWRDLMTSMQNTGAFDKLKNTFMGLVEQLTPLRNTFIDMFNTLKNFLIDSGIANLAVAIFGQMAAQIKLLAGAFRFLWQIAKPIISVIGTIISPIVTLMTKMIELQSKIPSGIGGLLSKGADFFGGNTTSEQISNTNFTAPNETEMSVQRQISENNTRNEQVVSINDNTSDRFSIYAPGADVKTLGYSGGMY
ncbi:MAG TPA: phage tail tape measure protein [Bacteroidales bacterium]|nr:phage tail tape measure protein [Bacteroidales bacterium]